MIDFFLLNLFKQFSFKHFPIVILADMRGSKIGFLNTSIGVGTVTIKTSESEIFLKSVVNFILLKNNFSLSDNSKVQSISFFIFEILFLSISKP